MNRPLTVGALVARLKRGLPLEQIGTGGLERLVTSADVSSPGLVLAGYIDRFPAHRLQAFGETEIAYLASLAPGPAVPAEESYDISKVTQEELVRGGELFRTNCTACHNFAGSGGALPNGRYAPSLMHTTPRNMYQAMLTGPQQMPVFSDDVLLPEDKRAIIAYIVGLQQQNNPGGFGLGRLGPVSEGLWGWLLGIGLLVVVAVWIGAKVPRVRGRRTGAKGN